MKVKNGFQWAQEGGHPQKRVMNAGAAEETFEKEKYETRLGAYANRLGFQAVSHPYIAANSIPSLGRSGDRIHKPT